MPRPADGRIAKARSRTALFAHVAARLERVSYKEHSRFFKDVLGVDVNGKAGRDAAAGTTRRTLRPWVLVDEPELDLDVSLLTFPPDEGRGPDEIFATLAEIPGVRQLMRLGTTGEVLAIVVFDGARARRELRALIEERVQVRPRWDEVERETFDPALRTWRQLTAKVAVDEDLRLGREQTETDHLPS